MANPGIALETLVWRVTWLRKGRRLTAEDRLTHVASVGRLARPLLQTCRSLRRVIFQEYESAIANPAVVFLLPSSDSALVKAELGPEDFPVWSAI